VERKLNSPSKASTAIIHPVEKGWQVRLSSAPEPTRFDTLALAAASLPAECEIEIALPVGLVVAERFTMPALDREELVGMVHLQLEKSLPFPVEDVTFNFQVIKQSEGESCLLAVAISNQQFASFCQPLRERSLFPQRASFYALHLGQVCPEDQTSLLIYQEDEKKVLAIYEKRKLAFVQILPQLPVAELMEELPAILFGAELDGVSTDFSGVCLERSLAEMESAIGGLLSLPVKLVTATEAPIAGDCDLLPESYKQERKQHAQTAQLKANLFTAAVVYLLLLAAGFGTLIWLQHRVSAIDSKLAALKPDIEFVNSRVARWNDLSPAIDRKRYVAELLYQVTSSLPSDGIRITLFEVSNEVNKNQFMVEGEAPTYALAVEFVDMLKKDAALQDYQFEVGPPTILANEHAQFRINANL
jgi:hypothetical protein